MELKPLCRRMWKWNEKRKRCLTKKRLLLNELNEIEIRPSWTENRFWFLWEGWQQEGGISMRLVPLKLLPKLLHSRFSDGDEVMRWSENVGPNTTDESIWAPSRRSKQKTEMAVKKIFRARQRRGGSIKTSGRRSGRKNKFKTEGCFDGKVTARLFFCAAALWAKFGPIMNSCFEPKCKWHICCLADIHKIRFNSVFKSELKSLYVSVFFGFLNFSTTNWSLLVVSKRISEKFIYITVFWCEENEYDPGGCCV